MPELEQRGGIGHRLNTQVDPRKCAHRLTVIDRVFKSFVSQCIPLLQKIDAQHPLYSYWRSPALARRVVWLNQLHQSLPRNHLFHLSKKLLPASHLLLPVIFGLRETELLLHDSHPVKSNDPCTSVLVTLVIKSVIP